MQHSNELSQPESPQSESETISSAARREAARLEALADAWLAGEIDNELTTNASMAATSVEALIEELVAPSAPLQPEHLRVLSDLNQHDAAIVQRDWPLIPTDRRRAVSAYLVELAEDDLTLHLGRILRIALDDEDPEVRRDAIRGLWEEISVDLAGPLMHMLGHDPAIRVREIAAETLGAYVLAGELDEFDATLAFRIGEALLAVLTDERAPLDVRRRALESMAYSGEAGVRQLIEDAYYSPEEVMRVSALVAMGRSGDVRWRGLVRAELQNPSPNMRLEAATACGELDAKASVNELIGLLNEDEQQPVRIAAIGALGQIGGKTAREALQAMRESDDPAEVEAADLALEELIFFADPANMLAEEEEELEELEYDPWTSWRDFDDDDLGSYEE